MCRALCFLWGLWSLQRADFFMGIIKNVSSARSKQKKEAMEFSTSKQPEGLRNAKVYWFACSLLQSSTSYK